jgi:signal transduction histidine kinase
MAVADQGPGIDPSLVEADNPRNTGLGLSIVRRIARSHGGRLSGVAPEGGGSLLVVWIPARGARPSSDPPVEALRAL